LSLGLSVPDSERNARFSAHDLSFIYREQGHRVFSKRSMNFFGLRNSKYRSGPLENLLEEYFGETALAEALVPVLVTSFDIERKKPKIFKSFSARQDAFRNFLMKDVARATSAAPTYFKPAEIFSMANENGRRQKIVAIDGGMCANNPSFCALCEAHLLYPNAAEYIIVSLGTGCATVSLMGAENMGLLEWGIELPSLLIDGPADITDHLLGSLSNIPQERLRYFRLQVELQRDNAAMDNVSPQNIATLLHRAETITGARTFQDLVQLLRGLPMEPRGPLQIADRRFSIL
jgi:hypothetical protein